MTYLIFALVTLFSQVDSTLLDGSKVPGELKSLSVDEAVLTSNGQEKTVPVSQLMDVVFSKSGKNNSTVNEDFKVQLIDNTSFHSKNILIKENDVSVDSASVGKVHLALGSIANIRLGHGDQKIVDLWSQLCSRENKKDLLVIKKGDVLDHLSGTITSISEERIHFLLDGSEISANRKKVFGVIYARNPLVNQEVFCKAYLIGDSVINISSITRKLDETLFHAEMVVGGKLEIPAHYLKKLDFSLTKIKYLSDMKPAEVIYTPFFDVEWKIQKDRNMDGNPIRLGRKKYEKGLCIHSKTYLRYRLSGDYRRFQTMIGIDDSVNKLGNVHVVISADSEKILDLDVSGSDDPRDIDLDVEGVRDLEIVVDFGSNLDISDHLDLANARFVK